MKSMGFYLLTLALLAFLGACGKNNESGKSYSNPYYQNQYGVINSPYAVVNNLMQGTPCRGAYQAHNNRVQVQQQIQFSPYASITNGDIFVGKTTAGDIGIIVGASTSAAGYAVGNFIGYICQRDVQFTNQMQPSINNVKVGMYSQCNRQFKTITSLDLFIPFVNPYGGMTSQLPLAFRDVCFQ